MTLLDGGTGATLDTPGSAFGLHALRTSPERVHALHTAYADAGAEVQTALTFRTTARHAGKDWRTLATRAVELARVGTRVAGSIAPIEDCWHPERSPALADPTDAQREHEQLAEMLVDAGADLLLCETFACVPELRCALDACTGRGVPVWASVTPGYDGSLVTDLGDLAAAAREHGADAVLVNCCPADRAHAYLAQIRARAGGLRVGVYANGVGVEPTTYGRLAATWAAGGASIVGGCCGTEPGHIAAFAARLQQHQSQRIRERRTT